MHVLLAALQNERYLMISFGSLNSTTWIPQLQPDLTSRFGSQEQSSSIVESFFSEKQSLFV